MKNRRWYGNVRCIVATLMLGSNLSIGTTAYAAQINNAPVITKASFLYNLFSGSHLTSAGTSPFDDVPEGSWKWKVVNAAEKMGIMAPDSATHFGISDPITLSQAADAINKILNLSLPPSVTAVSWLQDKGVLPSGSPSSDLTFPADLKIMSVLLGKGVQSLDYVPSSWKVTATQAEYLIRSLRVLYYLQWAQVGSATTVGLNYTLTPVALKNPQAVAQMKKLDQNERVETQTSIAPTSQGQIRSISSQTYLNGKKVQAIQLYLQGKKQYANLGSGWQLIHQQVGATALTGMQFQSGDLKDVTVTSQGTTFNYQGLINLSNPTVISELVQSYVKNDNLDLTQSQEAKLFDAFSQYAHATVSYQLHLTKEGRPMLTMEQQKIVVTIPSSDVPLNNESARSQFEQVVKYLTYSYESVQYIQFNQTPVSIPSGLPK